MRIAARQQRAASRPAERARPLQSRPIRHPRAGKPVTHQGHADALYHEVGRQSAAAAQDRSRALATRRRDVAAAGRTGGTFGQPRRAKPPAHHQSLAQRILGVLNPHNVYGGGPQVAHPAASGSRALASGGGLSSASVRGIGESVPGLAVREMGFAIAHNPKVAVDLPGQLAKFVGGAPAGAIESAAHPGKAAKGALADYKRRYGPLFRGDPEAFRKRLEKEGIAPEVVDLAGAATVTGAGVGRGLQVAARTGKLGARLERVATVRPSLRVSGNVSHEQELSKNLIRNAAAAVVDTHRLKVQARRAARVDAEGNPLAPIEVRQAQHYGQVTYATRRKQARVQRTMVAREKGASLARMKAIQQRETAAARRNLRSLTPEERSGFKVAMQLGVTSPAAARGIIERRIRDIEAHRAEGGQRVSARRDEIPALRLLHEHADKVFTPELRRVVREEQARERRIAAVDPGVDPVQAQLRRHIPQGIALGVERRRAQQVVAPQLELTREVKVTRTAAPAHTHDYQPTPEAISGRTWYHGTSVADLTPEKLAGGGSNIANLFGQGVYLTDDPKIARSYAEARSKRSGAPHVYEARVHPRKVLDMEAKADPEFADALARRIENLAGGGDPEAAAAIRRRAARGDSNAELYKAFSEDVSIYSHHEQIPRSELVEDFQILASELRERGFDALTHVGGTRAGKGAKLHQVVVLLDPENAGSLSAGRAAQSFGPATELGGESASLAVRQYRVAQQLVHRPGETDAEYLRRVKQVAKEVGLERPGYLRSEERPAGVFGSFALGGTKATEIPKAYKGTLFRQGIESHDPEVHVRGIARGIKRREQWNLVARNLDKHALQEIPADVRSAGERHAQARRDHQALLEKEKRAQAAAQEADPKVLQEQLGELDQRHAQTTERMTHARAAMERARTPEARAHFAQEVHALAGDLERTETVAARLKAELDGGPQRTIQRQVAESEQRIAASQQRVQDAERALGETAKGPGARNRSILELTRDLENAGVDPSTVAFWNPRKFYELSRRLSGDTEGAVRAGDPLELGDEAAHAAVRGRAQSDPADVLFHTSREGLRDRGHETVGFEVHLGTRRAAEDRAKAFPQGTQLERFRLPKDAKVPTAGARGSKTNPFSEEELGTLPDQVAHAKGYTVDPYRYKAKLRELRDKGYDAVYYRNEVEDPGSVSVLALDRRRLEAAPAGEAGGAMDASVARVLGSEGTDLQKALAESVVPGSAVLRGNPEDFANHTGFSVVPAEVLKEIEAQVRPSGVGARGFDIFRGKASRVLLGNPGWLSFQVASNAFLAGIGGAGPTTVFKAHRWWKSLPDHVKEAVAPELGIHGWFDEQTHLGATAANLPAAARHLADSWAALKNTGPWKLAHKANPFDAIFRADNAQNNAFRKAVLYKEVNREAYRRMGDNANRVMRSEQRIQRILRSAPEEQMRAVLEDPKLFEHHARALRDLLGDYTSYTAKERRTMGRYAMFYGFLRHSLRLTFFTLPIKHPIITAIGMELGQMHDRELRKLFGVSPPIWEEANAYISIGGKTRKFDVGRLNPFFNALQFQGPQSLLTLASPLATMTIDQLAKKNTVFDSQWRLDGSTAFAEKGVPVGAGNRAQIILEQLARLSPYYRMAEQTGIPGVAKPLRGRQGADSSLFFPQPTQFKGEAALASNQAQTAEQQGTSIPEYLQRTLAPFLGEPAGPTIRSAQDFARRSGKLPAATGGAPAAPSRSTGDPLDDPAIRKALDDVTRSTGGGGGTGDPLDDPEIRKALDAIGG